MEAESQYKQGLLGRGQHPANYCDMDPEGLCTVLVQAETGKDTLSWNLVAQKVLSIRGGGKGITNHLTPARVKQGCSFILWPVRLFLQETTVRTGLYILLMAKIVG